MFVKKEAKRYINNQIYKNLIENKWLRKTGSFTLYRKSIIPAHINPGVWMYREPCYLGNMNKIHCTLKGKDSVFVPFLLCTSCHLN